MRRVAYEATDTYLALPQRSVRKRIENVRMSHRRLVEIRLSPYIHSRVKTYSGLQSSDFTIPTFL